MGFASPLPHPFCCSAPGRWGLVPAPGCALHPHLKVTLRSKAFCCSSQLPAFGVQCAIWKARHHKEVCYEAAGTETLQAWLDFLISVSHGLARPRKNSVGCAQWSSTKNQPALGCHHLAITLCGLSFLRAVLSFISLPHSRFSLCPSHGYFHSLLCHASDRSRCDMTPLLLLLDSRCLCDLEDQAAHVTWHREDPQRCTPASKQENGECVV